MGILEQVMQMKSQGYGDQDISNYFQQQGVPPKDITDAINQANIKSAVSSEEPGIPNPAEETGGYYTPQTQEASYATAPTGQAEYYESQPGYAPAAGGTDSDTMIEIANQVFSEKIKKTENKVEDIEELKTVIQIKVNGMDERLKRIEKMIDSLQIQIIEKVGSYGKELESTKKEVSMLEDTLRKTIHTKAEETHSRKK